jgi:hypothetical protein
VSPANRLALDAVIKSLNSNRIGQIEKTAPPTPDAQGRYFSGEQMAFWEKLTKRKAELFRRVESELDDGVIVIVAAVFLYGPVPTKLCETARFDGKSLRSLGPEQHA